MLVHWHQPHLFKITMLTETNCMAWSRQDIQGNIAKIFNQANFAVILGADVSRHTIFGRLTSAATFHPGCQGWLVIANISIIMIIMMISPSSTLSPWSLIIANMPTKVTLKVWAPYLCQVRPQVQAAPAPGAPSTEEKLPRIAISIFHLVFLMGEWFN